MERVAIENLCIDIFWEWMEGEPEDEVKVLKRLKPGQEVSVGTMNAKIKDTMPFQAAIKKYSNAGLNIGKGDSEFGYRMPLPSKDDAHRELIIFRRNYGKQE